MWRLTATGKEAIDVCFALSNPKPVLEARSDVAQDELSVWELVLLLFQKGFRHVVKHRSRKDIAYDGAGDANKIWYTQPDALSVSRHYLLCLLRGGLEVPRWKPNAFYAALLEGKPYERKARPVNMLTNFDENDMDPLDKVAGAKKRRVATAPPRKERSPSRSPASVCSEQHAEADVWFAESTVQATSSSTQVANTTAAASASGSVETMPVEVEAEAPADQSSSSSSNASS